MEEIKVDNKLLGIKLKDIKDGSNPITKGNYAIQLVTLKHPKGTKLDSHYHKPKKRVTQKLQEAFYVRKGKVRLDIYLTPRSLPKRIYLTEGQLYISLSGGFGVTVLKDAEVLEFKNGPFIEDKVVIK